MIDRTRFLELLDAYQKACAEAHYLFLEGFTDEDQQSADQKQEEAYQKLMSLVEPHLTPKEGQS